MARPTKIVINCETKEEQILELTDEEIAQLEADRKAYEAEKAKQEAEAAERAEAKKALLKKLGISEAEAKLLLS
jgi:Spy/CpxP family protein refolding chaperone